MNTLTIEYKASVFTPAGWRGVDITALAEELTKKTVRVIAVLSIDGEEPHRGQSRTGAKRQTYDGVGVALREQGKNKRLSACRLI